MKKLFIIPIAVLLLAASCGKQAANTPAPQGQTQQGSGNAQTSGNGEVKPSGQTQTKDNANGPDYQPNGAPSGIQNALSVTVTQTVQGSNLNKPSEVIATGKTAIDLLRSSHTIETKTYSGIGEMVTSIDGMKADSSHFWSFYVNGKSSNVGASSYKVQNGDKIEWKLEEIK